MLPEIIFATHNSNKAKEIAALFEGICLVKSLNEIQFTKDIPETGNTLKENAWIKASTIYKETGLNCFADDTGLLVEALDGRPGVHSARYAGPNAQAAENNQKLLIELNHYTNRSAAFVTVICLCLKGTYQYFEGRLEGNLLTELRGSGGFGYDPLFVPIGFDRTLAEMSLEEKNRISHRGKALRKLLEFLSDQPA